MYHYIFDIGGVLIRYSPGQVIKILSEKTGCAYENIERLFHLDALYPVETGRISGIEFFETRVREVMPELAYDAWLQVFVDYFSVNPSGMALLQSLKERGKKVYILSNLAEFHKNALEKKIPGLFQLCHKNFLSYELGFHKPEEGIYAAVCKSIGQKPHNCVFFDDVIENVNGAKMAGWKGIHFSNERLDAIRKEIRDLE